MKYLSATVVNDLLRSSEARLIDIREPYEWEICSIGGIQIPMAEITSRLNDFAKDEALVIMCRSGKRAEAVANLLESDHGFENIIVLQGGLDAWISEVDPTLEA